MDKQPVVALLMGSKSDLPKLEKTLKTLKNFGIPFSAHVMSAHRTPAAVMAFAESAEAKGYKVILTAAGNAAHLGGVVAAHTLLPVIGIPVQGGALNGMDALLATVQMPGGIPVASVAIGSGGAMNAALFAIHILALSDPEVRQKLADFRASQQDEVAAADAELQNELKG